LLNDLFLRIFEMNAEKRITINNMKEHAVLRNKMTEDESTEEENSNEISSAIEWEINQMKFIQKIMRQVETNSFLTPSLLLCFKFYINKMVLCMLNKDSIKNYRKDKEGHPKLLKVISDMESDILVKMERLMVQIK